MRQEDDVLTESTASSQLLQSNLRNHIPSDYFEQDLGVKSTGETRQAEGESEATDDEGSHRYSRFISFSKASSSSHFFSMGEALTMKVYESKETLDAD